MGELVLDSSTHTFSEMEDKYQHYLAPGYEVYIEGSGLTASGVGVTSVTVDTSVEKADTFSFAVGNAFNVESRQFEWVNTYFTVGKKVEIKMGYVDTMETVFSGLVTSTRFDFPQDGPPRVIVSGMDKSFKMMKGIKSRSWLDKTHSDVASIIASENGLSAVTDSTAAVYKIVEQSRTTDYQFMIWLASENNYEFFVLGDKMYFRKPNRTTTPVITLAYGRNIISASIEVDLADQVTGVTVRGWDMSRKQEISQKSGSVTILGNGSKTGASILSGSCGISALEYVYTNDISANEAKNRADAILNEKAMKLISGHVEIFGIPEVRAGRHVKLEDMGGFLNNTFYIKSASHTIDDTGYTTNLSIAGNAIT